MKVHGYSQNLSDAMWKHGRAWLTIERWQFRAEWLTLKRAHFAGLTITFGCRDDQGQLFIGIPRLLCLWLSFGDVLPRRWFANWRYWDGFGRKTGIEIFEGTVRFSVWLIYNHDYKRTHIPGVGLHYCKHGFEITFNPADFFLGNKKYTERDISIAPATVALPEGEYPVTVRMFESTWKRPRWPKIIRIIRADVNSEKGIPSHAGKGECEWDLDDDALFGMTCRASTAEEAVRKVSESILRDRAKYGMPSLDERR